MTFQRRLLLASLLAAAVGAIIACSGGGGGQQTGQGQTTQVANDGRLPTIEQCQAEAKVREWGTSLRPIPSTVIDQGVMRNVPYASLRSGDYEINVYGDPGAPCCVEIGLYNWRIADQWSKLNCIVFLEQTLGDRDDRAVLRTLDLRKDMKRHGRLTFEITPETAEDAYGAWWVSVYDEQALDRARATPQELEDITQSIDEIRSLPPTAVSTPPAVAKPPTVATHPAVGTYREWTTDDLKWGRPVRNNDAGTSGGRVYVSGHIRANGHYVAPYTRAAPGSGSKKK